MFSKINITSLYYQGNSMSDIAEYEKCSIHKIAYWMSKWKIKRRNRSDALYLKLNPEGDPYHIKSVLNKKEILLLGLGLGIYIGEGEKVSRNSIRVANSDPKIIKLFIRFLIDICQIETKKLSYSLVCFNDSEPEKVVKDWAQILGITGQKFGKIVQIQSRGKGTYKRKSLNGVCTVSFHNLKLKSWLMAQIENPL